jgi:hypothetical protein
MCDITPPGPRPPGPRYGPPTIKIEVDAGVAVDADPTVQPATGCAASSAYLIPLVLIMVALATRLVPGPRAPARARGRARFRRGTAGAGEGRTAPDLP